MIEDLLAALTGYIGTLTDDEILEMRKESLNLDPRVYLKAEPTAHEICLMAMASLTATKQ